MGNPTAGMAGVPALRAVTPAEIAAELARLETSIANGDVAQLLAVMAHASALRAEATRILHAARIALASAARM